MRSPFRFLLLVLCIALLVSGGALLLQQSRFLWSDAKSSSTESIIHVSLLQGQVSDLHGAFSVDSVDNYAIQRDGKDAFSLFLAHYRDNRSQQRRAVLFSNAKSNSTAVVSTTDLRQTIWQEAGQAIKQNTPENALILSWWDEGQRIHFLSGRDVWVSKPAEQTFTSPIWRSLQTNLLLASPDEAKQLAAMARWLTMDSDKALVEIRQALGSSRPIYIIVTNDLLMRLGEISAYGGISLAFNTKVFQAHDNLHGDIAQIKQWSIEEGEGNYLVQKEGLNYHAWTSTKDSDTAKNTLLVRLLPFVDSLKKLPEGIRLVYQSHWGAYLSIYQLKLN